jgi:hypothetical protein
VHGYNVNAQQAREWNSTLFKNLYWSGLEHRFHAVTWKGDDSQTGGSFIGATKTPNYHINVLHAYWTAPFLADYIEDIGGADVLAAHSLGNMLSSCAIKQGAPVEKYFMLNAAVAKEAYDGTEFTSNMIHSDYQDLKEVHGGKIMASDWYRLFSSTNDLRSTLKWNDEFAAVAPKAYNLYSSGDQVFAAHDGNTEPSVFDGFTETWKGRYTWAIQEKRKGATFINGGGDDTYSNYGGWSFDKNMWGANYIVPPNGSIWAKPTDAELEAENENVFILTPLFKTGDGTENLTGVSDAQNFLSINDNRIRLLSGFIPATSYAAGHENFDEDVVVKNIDMNDARGASWPRLQESDGWKRGWWHSDIKDVAFPYTHEVFEEIMNEVER